MDLAVAGWNDAVMALERDGIETRQDKMVRAKKAVFEHPHSDYMAGALHAIEEAVEKGVLPKRMD